MQVDMGELVPCVTECRKPLSSMPGLVWLGVIREHGEWPLRPKGARSMAKNKKGSREQVILEKLKGAHKFKKGSREQQKIRKWSKEQEKLSRSKRKKEKGAGRKERWKGAVKIGKKERALKNGRENGVKCRKEQGAEIPLIEPHKYIDCARNCPPRIEAFHFWIMSVNLKIHHPNISSHAYPWTWQVKSHWEVQVNWI